MIRSALSAALLAPAPAAADDLREQIAADLPGLMAIYRDLHANPELSFAEVRSAAIMAATRRDGTTLPSLHSPFWAPDAEQVIATGSEALTSAAMRLMPKP